MQRKALTQARANVAKNSSHNSQMISPQKDRQESQQMESAQKNHNWEELSDHENMVDERQIEPDYFIDRPVSSHF